MKYKKIAWPFSLYFLRFAGAATYRPYLVLYYQSLSFTGAQIGLLVVCYLNGWVQRECTWFSVYLYLSSWYLIVLYAEPFHLKRKVCRLRFQIDETNL